MDELRHSLLQRADLFDDPRAYRAGVEDALQAVTDAQVHPGLLDRADDPGEDAAAAAY